jgi:hypothetical protein
MLVTFVVKNLTDDFMIRPTSKEFWALNAFLIGYGVRKLRGATRFARRLAQFAPDDIAGKELRAAARLST